MNKSKEVEAEILKALLVYSQKEPIESISALQKELKTKMGTKKANYPTIFRYTQSLIEKGFITTKIGTKKNGLPNKRNPHNLSLTIRGAIYLILNSGDLTKQESLVIIQKLLDRPEFKKLELIKNFDMLQISVDTLTSSFSRLQPKINLEHFNEDYALDLIFNELVIENCLEQVTEWKKKNDAKSKEHKEEMQRQARSDMRRLAHDPQYVKFREVFKTTHDYLRDQRDILNRKIDLLKPFIERAF